MSQVVKLHKQMQEIFVQNFCSLKISAKFVFVLNNGNKHNDGERQYLK